MPGNGVTTRRRDLATPLGRCRVKSSHTTPTGAPSNSDVFYDLGTPIPGTQITVSEGHQWPPPKGSLADRGGEFFTQKRYAIVDKTIHEMHLKENFYTQPGNIWTGTLVTDQYSPMYPMYPYTYGTSVWPALMHSSNAVLDAWGAKAIAMCKPTNSVADVAVALGEILKEGLPSLPGAQTWKSRAKLSKDAGGEYLNITFGWLPLVNEIRSVADAVSRADEILAQYERDSGKVVRRRLEFPLEESSVSQVLKTDATPYGPLSSRFQQNEKKGTLIRTVEKSTRRWFSGAFTYYLPSGYDSRERQVRQALLAKKLLGLSLTPDTLWNLAPWSWAIDWFTNTGDVISNLTDMATDGLVLRYGYIMEHTLHKVTYTLEGHSYQMSSAHPAPMSFVTETKIRRKANPFGFGVTWSGLSPRQLAILAALGLSRG